MAIRVAVLNHSPDILNRFQQFLQSHGFTVATFLQELGTLPNLNQFTADIVILGHTRGFPSNYPEFIRQLRANPATALLPILVCTTGQLVELEENGQKRVQRVSIGLEALHMEHVLVGIQLALNDDAAEE